MIYTTKGNQIREGETYGEHGTLGVKEKYTIFPGSFVFVVNELSVLLGCYAAPLDVRSPTFRDCVTV